MSQGSYGWSTVPSGTSRQVISANNSGGYNVSQRTSNNSPGNYYSNYNYNNNRGFAFSTFLYVILADEVAEVALNVYAIGEGETLGDWKDAKVELFRIGKTNLWGTNLIKFPATQNNFQIEYKYVVLIQDEEDNDAEKWLWENNSNRRLYGRPEIAFDVNAPNFPYIDNSLPSDLQDRILLAVEGIMEECQDEDDLKGCFNCLDTLLLKFAELKEISTPHKASPTLQKVFHFCQSWANGGTELQLAILSVLMGYYVSLDERKWRQHYYSTIYSQKTYSIYGTVLYSADDDKKDTPTKTYQAPPLPKEFPSFQSLQALSNVEHDNVPLRLRSSLRSGVFQLSRHCHDVLESLYWLVLVFSNLDLMDPFLQTLDYITYTVVYANKNSDERKQIVDVIRTKCPTDLVECTALLVQAGVLHRRAGKGIATGLLQLCPTPQILLEVWGVLQGCSSVFVRETIYEEVSEALAQDVHAMMNIGDNDDMMGDIVTRTIERVVIPNHKVCGEVFHRMEGAFAECLQTLRTPIRSFRQLLDVYQSTDKKDQLVIQKPVFQASCALLRSMAVEQDELEETECGAFQKLLQLTAHNSDIPDLLTRAARISNFFPLILSDYFTQCFLPDVEVVVDGGDAETKKVSGGDYETIRTACKGWMQTAKDSATIFQRFEYLEKMLAPSEGSVEIQANLHAWAHEHIINYHSKETVLNACDVLCDIQSEQILALYKKLVGAVFEKYLENGIRGAFQALSLLCWVPRTGKNSAWHVGTVLAEELICLLIDSMPNLSCTTEKVDSSMPPIMSIFGESNFWLTVFQLVGHVDKLRERTLFVNSITELHSLADRLVTRTCTLKELEYVFNVSDETLLRYLTTALNVKDKDNSEKITLELLRELRTECNLCIKKKSALSRFVQEFAKEENMNVTVLPLVMSDKEICQQFSSSTLKEVCSPVFWESFPSSIIEIALEMIPFHDYNTFQNICEMKFAENMLLAAASAPPPPPAPPAPPTPVAARPLHIAAVPSITRQRSKPVYESAPHINYNVNCSKCSTSIFMSCPSLSISFCEGYAVVRNSPCNGSYIETTALQNLETETMNLFFEEGEDDFIEKEEVTTLSCKNGCYDGKALIVIENGTYHCFTGKEFCELVKRLNLPKESEDKIVKYSRDIIDEYYQHAKSYTSSTEKVLELPLEETNKFWKNVPLPTLKNEFVFIGRLMHSQVVKESQRAIHHFLEYDELKLRHSLLVGCLEVFKINPSDATVALRKKAQDLKTGCFADRLNLSIELKSSCSKISDDDWGSIMQLAEATDLVAFIKDTENEDLRSLIDAVEEHSDSFVRESTVSDLLRVQSFLLPLLKVCGSQSDRKEETFLLGLVKGLEQARIVGKPTEQLHTCNENIHGIKRLYDNVANRGEVTKEIVTSVVTSGTFTFEIKEISRAIEVTVDEIACSLVLSYVRADKSKAEFNASDIGDLRSRCLLIVNSEGNEEESEEMKLFISLVDMAFSVSQLVTKLHIAGHFDYRNFTETLLCKIEVMSDYSEQLKTNLSNWATMLEESRCKYSVLKYFFSRQLWTLFDWVDSNNKAVSSATAPNTATATSASSGSTAMNRQASKNGEDVVESTQAKPMEEQEKEKEEQQLNILDLLRFVQPSLSLESLLQDKNLDKFSFVNSDNKNKNFAKLEMIGQWLDLVFVKREHLKRRDFALDKSGSDPALSELSNAERSLFVAVIDNKKRISNSVMALYMSYGKMADPSDILFCHSNTTWDEVHLILLRCEMQVEDKAEKGPLFSIVNIQNLSFEIQSKLIAHLSDLHINNPQNIHTLALVCVNNLRAQHIIDQLSRYVVHVNGLTDECQKRVLTGMFEEIQVFSSEYCGLGKTYEIHKLSEEKNKSLCTFPINGPIKIQHVLWRLQQHRSKGEKILHFDLGVVDDFSLLNTILFELIVIGALCCSTEVYHSSKDIYIELANTFNNGLSKELSVCNSFHSKHLVLDYDRIVVPVCPSTPMQTVCRYLQAHRDNIINNVNLGMSEESTSSIPTEECRDLLQTYFFKDQESISFSLMHAFLNVLGDQLNKMSDSCYFNVDFLEVEEVRSELFSSLLDTSLDFATRSVSSSRQQQQDSQNEIATATDSMLARAGNMINWESSNHLLVIFHSQDPQTITSLYRDHTKVPRRIRELLQSQQNRLVNLHNLPAENLLQRLEMIARFTWEDRVYPSYALTADNLLKMALIILRIRASVPVIIVGETGCGKTSLIKFLANVVEVSFQCLNFHAGTNENVIISFIEKCENLCRSSGLMVWAFLDEVNTCEHLGLVSELLCHRKLHGRSIHPNLLLLAASNPYRLRVASAITSGLSGKVKVDDKSKLVYRVHPLPESMLDFVWDFGSLQIDDERCYITSMVGGLGDNLGDFKSDYIHFQHYFVHMLAGSQQFIRRVEGSDCCVSMRDVKRCVLLVKWFILQLDSRQKLVSQKRQQNQKEWGSNVLSHRPKMKIIVKAMVLAIAHCYHARLQDAETRESFRSHIAEILSCNRDLNFKAEDFHAILKQEQLEILHRMTLPPGTAMNEALAENVFVLLVCILNRIPVFLVGPPGCSKSLSMRLINANLRGPDSKDPYFRTLPQVYTMSYQGSQSSTSDGIQKIFDKAMKYQNQNTDGVIAVVLLDEVGLAEVSPHNPLKVLHSLLEPEYPKECPEVAVVGISNWALDAAKMNRAVLLSRPRPDVEDLYATSTAVKSACKDDNVRSNLSDAVLMAVAKAYYRYHIMQSHAEFHGLRDFYALIKEVSRSMQRLQTEADDSFSDAVEDLDSSDNLFVEDSVENQLAQSLHLALQRNFGGLMTKETNMQDFFREESSLNFGNLKPIPILDLVTANLNDPDARHLMLITESSDVAVDLVQNCMNKIERQCVVIYGSGFPEDCTDSYRYRILSRIILCMEMGVCLILQDLDEIYGSLYDMLNQNYFIVGNKKHCRIALGAFSNPVCEVHADFRCVVLMNETKVQEADPPFLNRFEKQRLQFEHILTPRENDLLQSLDEWTTDLCLPVRGNTKASVRDTFSTKDMFVGFHDITLPSLVLRHSRDTKNKTEEDEHALIEKCKTDLLWVSSVEAALRMSTSKLGSRRDGVVSALQRRVLYDLPRADLHQCLEHIFSQRTASVMDQETWGGLVGLCMVVTTYSSVFANISDLMKSAKLDSLSALRVTSYKVGSFPSEIMLEKDIASFWEDDSSDVLALHFDAMNDMQHIRLTRTVIDTKRLEYLQRMSNNQKDIKEKHILMFIHMRRQGATVNVIANATSENKTSSASADWRLNFLSHWQHITIDTLEPSTPSLADFLDITITDIIEHQKVIPFDSILDSVLLWAFQCIKYPSDQVTTQHVQNTVGSLIKNDDIKNILRERILNWLRDHDEICHQWQIKVAFDRQLLLRSTTFRLALKNYVLESVRIPLAQLIYQLEKNSVLRTLFSLNKTQPVYDPELLKSLGVLPEDEEAKQQLAHLCLQNIQNKNFMSIKNKAPPTGPECYAIESAQAKAYFPSHAINITLLFPFSFYLMKKMEEIEDVFMGVGSSPTSRDTSNLGSLVDIVSTRVVPEIFVHPLQNNFKFFLNDFVEVIMYQGRQRSSWMKAIPLSQMRMLYRSLFNACLTTCAPAPNHPLGLFLQTHVCYWTCFEIIFTLAELLACANMVMDSSEICDLLQKGKFEAIEDLESMVLSLSSDSCLPTEKVLSSFGHIERWLSCVRVILAAEKVTSVIPAVLTLKVCYKFVSMFALPCNLSIGLVSNLVPLDRKYNNDQRFAICEKVILSLKPSSAVDEHVYRKSLDRFVCSSVLEHMRSGLDANPLKRGLDLVFKQIQSSVSLVFLLPIFREILSFGAAAANMSLSEYGFTIAKGENHDEMMKNVYYSSLYSCIQSYNDSDSAVCSLLTSVIQTTCFDETVVKTIGNKNDVTATQSLLQVGKKVDCFLSNESKEKKELQNIFSVSLIRSLVDACVLSKDTIDMIYDFVSCNSSSIYVLKSLRTSSSIEEVKEFALKEKSKKHFPYFKSLSWEMAKTNHYNYYVTCDTYDDATGAIGRLLNEDSQECEEFITNDVSCKVSLMGACLFHMHRSKLGKSVLSAKESVALQWLQERNHLSKNCVSLISNYSKFDSFLQSVSSPRFTEVIQHLSLISSAQTDCYFNEYIFNLKDCLENQFILSGANDLESSILQALYKGENMPHTRYECSCGNKFIVGDCGALNEESICPECQQKIAYGHEQFKRVDEAPLEGTEVANTEKDKQIGYIQEDPNQDLKFGLRHLPPLSYRLLHFFVHALFLAAIASQSAKDTDLEKLKTSKKSKTKDIVDVISIHLENDFKMICGLLDLNEEYSLLAMHNVISKLPEFFQTLPVSISGSAMSSTNRTMWEQLFSEWILEAMPNPKQQTDTFLRELIEKGGMQMSPAQMVIDECLTVSQLKADTYVNRYRSVIYRPLQTCVAQLLSSPSLKAEFPILALYFANMENLSLVKHLSSLITWCQFVSSKLQLSLTREDAQNMSVQEFINRFTTSPKENAEVKKYFASFQKAWSSVRPSLTRFECHDFKDGEIKEVTLDSSIITCCLEKRDVGLYLCSAFELLSNYQNDFVEKVAALLNARQVVDTKNEEGSRRSSLVVSASSSTLPPPPSSSSSSSSAIITAQTQTGSSGFFNYEFINQLIEHNEEDLKKDVMSCSKDDIISYSLKSNPTLLTTFSSSNPEYGRGKQTIVDYASLELGLIRSILHKKPKLDISDIPDSFLFDGELFQSFSTILEEVKVLVPQSKISDVEAKGVLHDIKSSNESSSVLQMLGMILWFVKRTGGSVEQTIGEYAAVWVTTSNMQSSGMITNWDFDSIKSLRLKHLVSLYELVEEELSKMAVSCLNPKYTEEIPEEVLAETKELIIQKLRPKSVLTALRRFVFRYINNEEGSTSSNNSATFDPQEPLTLRMRDDVWPTNTMLILPKTMSQQPAYEPHPSDFIPDDLLLCHLQSLCKHLSLMA